VGYGAFWLGPGSASQAIIDQLPWIPYQSHNGYLDILNELGVVGMALFIGMLVVHIWQLFKLVPINRQESAFHGTLLVIICFSNFSESTLFRGVNYPHILLMFSSISVSSTLYRHRAKLQDAASQTVQQVRKMGSTGKTSHVVSK
jgi:O-antigen ligase